MCGCRNCCNWPRSSGGRSTRRSSQRWFLRSLFNLRTLCRRYFQCQALVVGSPEVDVGIEVLIDRPEEVGADRLVNAVGAFVEYGGPKIIVDFGTATTFDVIDAKGSYLGGVIAPGVNLSIEALHRASAQLPRVAIGRPPEHIIGKNTVQAMRAGIFWGYVGMIEGVIARIRRELGSRSRRHRDGRPGAAVHRVHVRA